MQKKKKKDLKWLNLEALFLVLIVILERLQSLFRSFLDSKTG